MMKLFTYLSIVFLFYIFPYSAQSNNTSWEEVNKRAIEFRDSGDCTSAWTTYWENRKIPNGYPYMNLSVKAVDGAHPYDDKSVENNIAVAGKLALLAVLNSEVEIYDVLENYPEEKRDELVFLQAFVRASLAKYYKINEAEKQCFLDLTKSKCITEFAKPKNNLAKKIEDELDTILASSELVIECIKFSPANKRK